MKYRRRRCTFRFRWLVLLFFTVYMAVSVILSPQAISLTEMEIRRAAQIAIHQSVKETIVSLGELYEDVGVKTDGTISYLHTDASRLTEFQTQVCTAVSQAILDVRCVSVRFGSLTPLSFLSAKGPKIPLRLEPDGVAEVSFENEFVSAGVNQTLHRVRMDVTVHITAKALWYSNRQVVQASFILGETVIVGDVPGGVYAKWGP